MNRPAFELSLAVSCSSSPRNPCQQRNQMPPNQFIEGPDDCDDFVWKWRHACYASVRIESQHIVQAPERTGKMGRRVAGQTGWECVSELASDRGIPRRIFSRIHQRRLAVAERIATFGQQGGEAYRERPRLSALSFGEGPSGRGGRSAPALSRRA